jgi:hypothetical protein
MSLIISMLFNEEYSQIVELIETNCFRTKTDCIKVSMMNNVRTTDAIVLHIDRDDVLLDVDHFYHDIDQSRT